MIPKDVLKKINDEYKTFISKKTELQKYVKDVTTKMCKQIDEINVPSLNLYLSTRYTSVNNYIICECGKECKNKQAYSAHKRGCTK
jgi:predicted KAP-like P-loop ATPase